MEAIAPLIRYTSPIARYQYFNSLTVEYGDVGRIGEAQNVCKIVLASPYAFAYPEWRETEQDMALRGYKSRSSVRVIQTFPGNVAYLSERQREPSDTSIHPNIFGPAPVRSLQKWKEEKMVKEPNGDDLPPDANEKDLYLKIMEMIAQKDLSISELRQVIAFVEKLSSKSKS